jgi:microsomal dipeptidase-like Zn-dependent dipeptidase
MKSYIDIHCHPSLKPYSKSFKSKALRGKHSLSPNERHSIWYQKRSNDGVFKRLANKIFGVTKWRQSDFKTSCKSGAEVLVVSLYPMEKGMLINEKTGKPYDTLIKVFTDFATGFGQRRLNYIREMPDYFSDLKLMYNFYRQLNNRSINIDGIQKKYKLVRTESEIDYNANNTIQVILSIEGAHVFNCGLKLAGKPVADEIEVLQNVSTVKNWDYRPFFIGISHHFDNELCGYSKSIEGFAGSVIVQKVDDGQGITPLGHKVIDKLLSNINNQRIFIDVKHMNPKSRHEYYDVLKTKYANESIPIIVSHGALNGKLSYKTHNHVAKAGFNTADINFFFEELLFIERSKGIFGIQLDERRIFNKKNKDEIYKKAKPNMTLFGKPRLRKNAYFIWRQIQYSAWYLDIANLNAWDIQCLGTDFDGIIDPLNGWWTADDLDKLSDYLEHHAQDYLNSPEGRGLKSKNRLTAKQIVQKIMIQNAKDFITRNF